MRPLSQRQKDILSGASLLSEDKIISYRDAWRNAGFDVDGFLGIPNTFSSNVVPGAVDSLNRNPDTGSSGIIDSLNPTRTAAKHDQRKAVSRHSSRQEIIGPSKKALTEDEAMARFPCAHRNVTDEKHVCKPCLGARVHTLCDCSLLNRKCTVLASSDAKDPVDGKRIETCMTCEVRSLGPCLHESKGCCRLAAVLGSIPVNECRVTPRECMACRTERDVPEIDSPTRVVREIAVRGVETSQPSRAVQVRKELGVTDPAVTVKRPSWRPSTSGYLKTQQGTPCELGGVYRGATVVLVCGGPSLNTMDLSVLDQRGVVVAAVNQVAATHVRPRLWFSIDPPEKFHPAIWTDPGILCFVKALHSKKPLRAERGGELVPSNLKPIALPNVLTFDRRHEWGGDFLAGPPMHGNNANRSVLLVALRILADLGFARIVLIGADFQMEPEKSYAFDQRKDETAARSNNAKFRRLNTDLVAIGRTLRGVGVEVVNATPGSHLTAFPTADFAEEVKRVAIEAPASVDGWYR